VLKNSFFITLRWPLLRLPALAALGLPAHRGIGMYRHFSNTLRV